MNREKQFSGFKLFVLGFFVFSLYLSVIIFLRTEPFSDFKFYYETALAIQSEGKVGGYYKYFAAPGYPYLLSLLFDIFKSESILIPQVFNALILTFLCLLLANYNFVENGYLKLVGFLTFAFSINYLPMVSVLCSEIPYALFLGGGLLLVSRVFKKMGEPDSVTKLAATLILFFSGIVFGVSQFIRPVTTPLLFLLTVILPLSQYYFVIERGGEILGRRLSVALQLLLPVWAGFLGTALVLYYLSSYGLTFQPLQNGLGSMYIGFNAESRGVWNPDDSRRIREIGERTHWNAREFNQEFRPMVIERLKKGWLTQLKIVPDKLVILLKPSGIPFWALDKSSIKDPSPIYRICRYFSFMNLFVMLVSLTGFLHIFMKRKVSLIEFFVSGVTLAVFINILLHAYLLEVQGRYSNHLWLILFWCFPFYLRETIWVRRKCVARDG
jgi:hypothetical protein